MARIKAVKIEPCSTRAEFEEAVNAAAKCSVQREKLVAELKLRHQAIDDKFGAAIKALEVDIKTAHERATPYFEAHAGELCAPGRRSGSTKLANFGVRLGLPTVTKSGKFKKVAWKALGIIFDGEGPGEEGCSGRVRDLDGPDRRVLDRANRRRAGKMI